MLVDLRNKNITGKDAEHALDEAGVTVNKNTIPFDPQSPFVTSGVRIGTPAVTTRGMKEAEMKTIAEIINLTITHHGDGEMKKKSEKMVQELTSRFPLFAWD
jgi:glycine hydroxymethyltransferase